MKTILSVVFALMLCAPAAHAGCAGYDVFLLVGQSNMAGRGKLPTPLDPDGQAADGIMMWDPARGIVPASDPLIHTELGKKPTAAGPAMSFAKSYKARLVKSACPERRILLVGAAWGGTGFKEKVPGLGHRWLVTRDPAVGGDLYREAVTRANAAMVAAAAEGEVRFMGILWHQGESDLSNHGVAEYDQNFRTLMTALRTEIPNAKTAPVIVGEMTPCFLAKCVPAFSNLNPQEVKTFLTLMHTLPHRLAHSAWVSSEGLTDNGPGDEVHFNLASQRELGRRYFKAFLKVGTGRARHFGR